MTVPNGTSTSNGTLAKQKPLQRAEEANEVDYEVL